MNWRPLLALRLLLRFFGHCVLSGVSTARIILGGAPTAAGLVRLPFAPLSTTGAAVLGALVTLSPGTTTLDIDLERRELLLHLLDTRHAEATLAAIRRDFEQDVMALFPEKKA